MRMGSRVEVKYFVDTKTMTDYSGKKGQALTRERGGKWGVRIDGREGPNLVIPEKQLKEIPWTEGE
ncbi:hypothetical protein SEA_WATERMOORE_199 [Streptomyces phage Watermoore]|uniref:Uncharacterized protein n=3 Tax=Samistivirus peebs TaxID=2560790 RepID=A0A890UV04_9CAUD|nr:hypothetical protein SEA_SUSHI23_200 [Streptomyces phage Sushi23]QAX95894.1 hypothetical protein SEA_TEUTSCH_200 [Streptomyces phage Teutsch]QRI46150.1 hypothetical protein SEA_CROSS_199 [Streptomyces phage Cross]WNN95521.1 hypothetical protein SEA_WATERMOORE_199 [Streptomyces phage Watermoore]